MTLHVDAVVRRGDFVAEARLDVQPREPLALIGPNGAGKTTLLHAIAGLKPIERGSITLNGRDVTAMPAHRRQIGMLAQDPLLFPHLTALGNVEFGLRVRGMPTEPAANWFDRLGLGHRKHAKPADLSGGQAQLVAIARALAARPDALLLDEPLTALDPNTRATVRAELAHLVRNYGGPVIAVAHDPVDVLALAKRVVVLEGGHVTQHDSVGDVFARPRTQFAAQFAGLNVLRGSARDGALRASDGRVVYGQGDAVGDAIAAFRPTSVVVHNDEPHSSARNSWRVQLERIESLGDVVRVTTVGPNPLRADVTPLSASALDLRPATAVWFAVKATEVDIYPA